MHAYQWTACPDVSSVSSRVFPLKIYMNKDFCYTHTVAFVAFHVGDVIEVLTSDKISFSDITGSINDENNTIPRTRCQAESASRHTGSDHRLLDLGFSES